MKLATDAISRQAAISHLDSTIQATNPEGDYNQGFIDGAEFCKGFLADLPSAQPNLQPTCNQLATDCVSRQAAIDVLNEQIEQCNKALSSFDISMKDEYAVKVERASLKAYKEQLENLPSAQPEIVRCKDCKYWTHIKRTNRYWCKTDDGLYDLNPSLNDFCSRAERRTDG